MSLPPVISRFLSVSLGMDADAAGKGSIDRVVAAAMRREGIPNPKVYEQLIFSSEDVRQRFINAVVVGETWFFRDRNPFTHLARHTQELWQKQGGETLRLLSAPCSTGEEPYSIAMTLLAAGLPPSSFRIDGVDISTGSLEAARRACYGNSSFRGNIVEDVAHFFRATSHGRQVVKDVTRQVVFHQDNLVSPDALAGLGPYAVIFCRNLLIYLTPEARRQVFTKLDGLLVPGGILFTGHTETIFWHQQGYTPLKWDRAFALTKPVSLPAHKKTKSAAPVKTLPIPSVRRREIKTADDTIPAAGKATPEKKTVPSITPLPVAADRQPSGEKSLLPEELQEARRLADRGDMDAAVRLCQGHDKKAGPAAETYCLLGVIQMARRDMKGAEDFFLKALYLDPGHYESLVHLSLICRQKGDEHKASLYRKRAERKADAGKHVKRD